VEREDSGGLDHKDVISLFLPSPVPGQLPVWGGVVRSRAATSAVFR
jgi:hypothetical protein